MGLSICQSEVGQKRLEGRITLVPVGGRDKLEQGMGCHATEPDCNNLF